MLFSTGTKAQIRHTFMMRAKGWRRRTRQNTSPPAMPTTGR